MVRCWWLHCYHWHTGCFNALFQSQSYSLSQDISLELFNEELVLSSLARCLSYCESAGLWLNGACCLDHSRNCEPLLHTSDDVLLPMVFIKQVVNMLRVCGPVQTVFTGPVRVAAQYVIPTQRGGGGGGGGGGGIN